jgi:hypothetical protein
MIGYSSFSWKDLIWRSLPYGGVALLSPPRDANNLQASFVRNYFFGSHPDCLYIRWENDFDSLTDSPWWHIIKDKDSGYTLDSYSSKVRNQIRRGLRSYYCKPISPVYVAHNYKIYFSAFESYDTFEHRCSEAEFISNLRTLPSSTEFWGVFSVNDDTLVGFSENYIQSGTCFFNSIWILPVDVKQYAAYVLFYDMIAHYLGDREFDYVSDGAKSLSHSTQIHHFLESKFGFRKAYTRLRVEYVPWLRLLVYIMYPFKGLLYRFNFSCFKKISILLHMETIRRSCELLV